jgi:pyruvate formate lyase activating enzyme
MFTVVKRKLVLHQPPLRSFGPSGERSSKEIVWRPDTVQWGASGEMGAGSDGGWYGRRAVLHPLAAVELAQRWECSQIEFGINEPTLTFEYTYDVATLAHAAGLDVVVETNGFTTRQPIRRLAPLADAVDVGIKGSGEPEFYATQMRSPGAMDAVRAAMIEWRRAGVHLIVGDVVAPSHLQDDVTAAEAHRRLYGWIADPFG